MFASKIVRIFSALTCWMLHVCLIGQINILQINVLSHTCLATALEAAHATNSADCSCQSPVGRYWIPRHWSTDWFPRDGDSGSSSACVKFCPYHFVACLGIWKSSCKLEQLDFILKSSGSETCFILYLQFWWAVLKNRRRESGETKCLISSFEFPQYITTI